MIGRRATVGLSLLCALAFCAFAAQSASAAKAKNTTAFTCVKGGGSLDFKDAHCDEKVEAKKGEYGHVLIPLNETTEITVTNEKTATGTSAAVSAILTGELAGVKLEITCKTVHGEGFIHNVEEVNKVHTVTGTITTKFTNCEVKKPLKCVVNEPIEVKSEFEGVEELGAGKDTHGVEFKPHEGGKTFVEITLKNKGEEKCSLNGTTFPVEGTAIGTGTPSPKEKHSGATAIFTNEMTTETLKIGGKPAGFSASTTVQMKGGNPISLTTTT